MNKLSVIFFNCGQGDMTLIKFPSGKTMLIDVCLNDENDRNIDLLLEELNEDTYGNKILDYLVITHPHNDHIKNIGFIPKLGIIIQNIWESGHRLYITREDRQNGEYQNYDDMKKIISNFKKTNKNGYMDLEARVTPIVNIQEFGEGVKIYIFSPSLNICQGRHFKAEQEKLIHKHCAVIKIEYNNRSIMFTGDSNYSEWEDRIVHEEVELTEGNFNLEHVRRINASAYIVSVGKNRFGHPNRQALELYESSSAAKSCIYLTKEQGTIIAHFFQHNFWEIYPLKFLEEEITNTFTTDLEVSPAIPWYRKTYKKGTELTVKAKVKGNVESIKKIIWQIQNNGVGEDDVHHELFYEYDFFDELVLETQALYEGRHIVRCAVYDEDGNCASATAVIPVTS